MSAELAFLLGGAWQRLAAASTHKDRKEDSRAASEGATHGGMTVFDVRERILRVFGATCLSVAFSLTVAFRHPPYILSTFGFNT